MQKMNSNIIMTFVLAVIGLYLVLGWLLYIPFSNTRVILSFILLFFIIVILHGWKTLGARELLVFFLIAYGIPLLYEYSAGLGFGELVGCTCSYSNLLGPKIFGTVPYVIPLVWSMALYCTFTMTNIMFNRVRTTHRPEEKASLRWFLRIIGMGIVAGLIMASLDLIIDPVMVTVGAWSWLPGGGSYYGVPLWNYEGWIEITAVTFVFYTVYLHFRKKSQIYVGGEQRSRYTLFVVAPYLAALVIFGAYAVREQVTYVIPWAVMTMVLFASIVVLQFYRSYTKGEKEILSLVE